MSKSDRIRVLATLGGNPLRDSQVYPGRRTFYLCGAAAGALIFGAALTGVLVEAREVWRESGATFYLADAAMRLFLGACLGILAATPYLLLERASRKPHNTFTKVLIINSCHAPRPLQQMARCIKRTLSILSTIKIHLHIWMTPQNVSIH